MNADSERLNTLRPALELRARVLGAIRDFFRQEDFLEVETPVRVQAPAPELHIDAEPSGSCFLRTSPELHMKRLLAAGCERIFQVGPCFRRGEYGPRHHAEYTMLEWYRAGTDYLGILDDTTRLLRSVARQVLGRWVIPHRGGDISLDAEWPRVTVADAFREAAGWDPTAAFDADRFDLDLVDKVEPGLRRDVPVVLMDFPPKAGALARLSHRRTAPDEKIASRQPVRENRLVGTRGAASSDAANVAAPFAPALRAHHGPGGAHSSPGGEECGLARIRPGPPQVAERWELFMAGVELANAYSELTDPVEQEARFRECAARRAELGKDIYPVDEEFLRALKAMPESGGIALGVDRLVMLLAGFDEIGDVIAFREQPPL